MTDAPLAAQEAGRPGAPTVVLLHGVMASGWMWQRTVPLLEEEFHLLLVDLPGHGESRRRPWASLADTASAVADLVSARAADGTAHLVGTSLGGCVAVELAALRPDLVPAAVVSGVSVLPFPDPRRMRAAGRLTGPLLAAGTLPRAGVRGPLVAAEDVAGYAEAARATAPGTYERIAAELLDHRVPAGATTSAARVLAVAGEREQNVVRQSLPLLAGAFPAGTARLVPGAGHGWSAEVPDLFARTVRAHARGEALPAELLDPDVPRRRSAPRP
ncbi:alpha-beta hydrolase superfamily lysophospholipase [Kineococcus xinjiangensis]|uniref:Alpha-beta hydrolase superfamily lysophospholipase n=1 Tax=Kineococcus xinjiangensis TaxID=512762 RepID=A0A2S6IEL2_9ACTN|nr:alpha/beta fold hydrolase [Kineococcus xinjiangensis]PPK92633.1 alpha-beta hydrolase superfamily lysophospholipase [Kineococcus xinjiangensis]